MNAILALLSSSLALACVSGTITGAVTLVRDGDTIEVAGLPIRLSGAAPELGAPGSIAGQSESTMSRLVLDVGKKHPPRPEFPSPVSTRTKPKGPPHMDDTIYLGRS